MPCGDRNDKRLVLSFEERLMLLQSCVKKYMGKQKVRIRICSEEIEMSKQKKRMIETYELLQHFK